MFWGRRNFQSNLKNEPLDSPTRSWAFALNAHNVTNIRSTSWSKNDFETFFQTVHAHSLLRDDLVAKDAKQARKRNCWMLLTDGKKLRGGDLRRAVQKGAQQGKTSTVWRVSLLMTAVFNGIAKGTVTNKTRKER